MASIGYTGTNVYNFLKPTSTTFNANLAFSSNPRSIQVVAKFIF